MFDPPMSCSNTITILRFILIFSKINENRKHTRSIQVCKFKVKKFKAKSQWKSCHKFGPDLTVAVLDLHMYVFGEYLNCNSGALRG